MESLALTRSLFTFNGTTVQRQPSHKPKAAQISQAANVIIDEKREKNKHLEMLKPTNKKGPCE